MPSVVHLVTLYEVYARLKDGGVLTDAQSTRFLSIVQDADLSSPPEGDLLGKARAALADTTTMDGFLGQKALAPLAKVDGRLFSSAALLDAGRDLAEIATS